MRTLERKKAFFSRAIVTCVFLFVFAIPSAYAENAYIAPDEEEYQANISSNQTQSNSGIGAEQNALIFQDGSAVDVSSSDSSARLNMFALVAIIAAVLALVLFVVSILVRKRQLKEPPVLGAHTKSGHLETSRLRTYGK